jgi:hypothetical protein
VAKRTREQSEPQAVPMPEMASGTREFHKHAPTGEIWAIEWMDARKIAAAGARRCSRPEEQTLGALPVLDLSCELDTALFVDRHLEEFEAWAPPRNSEEMFTAILQAGAEAEEAKAVWQKSAAKTKELRGEWEDAVDTLQGLIKAARDGRDAPPELPFDDAGKEA